MFKTKDGEINVVWKVFFTYLAAKITNIFALGLMGPATSIEVRLIAQELIFIFIPVLMWTFTEKKSLSLMGIKTLKEKASRKHLLCGLLSGIAAISVVFAGILFIGSARLEIGGEFLSFSQDSISFLIVFILVGTAEEFFFRGYMVSVLKQTKNEPVIIIASALLFAWAHNGNNGFSLVPFLNISLIGILFALMYIKSGDIWMSIGFHIVWNYFQGVVYGLPVSGIEISGICHTVYEKNNLINGGTFGPEGGLIVTVVAIITIVIFLWHFRDKGERFFI